MYINIDATLVERDDKVVEESVVVKDLFNIDFPFSIFGGPLLPHPQKRGILAFCRANITTIRKT